MCELELTPLDRFAGGKVINVNGYAFRFNCGGSSGQENWREKCAFEAFKENFDTNCFDQKRDTKLLYPCLKKGGQFTANLVNKKRR